MHIPEIDSSARRARRIVIDAFERIGGFEELLSWIKRDPQNMAAFWDGVRPRLSVRELSESVGPVRHIVEMKLPQDMGRSRPGQSKLLFDVMFQNGTSQLLNVEIGRCGVDNHERVAATN